MYVYTHASCLKSVVSVLALSYTISMTGRFTFKENAEIDALINE